MRVEQLDAMVTEALVEAVCTPERCRTMLEALVANDGPVARQLATDAVRRRREIQELERSQANLLRAVEDGTASGSLVGARLTELSGLLAAARVATEQVQPNRRSEVLDNPAFVESFRTNVARRLTADGETLRALLRGLVDAVVVDPEGIRIVPKVEDQKRSA
jgi:hypothetical protein